MNRLRDKPPNEPPNEQKRTAWHCIFTRNLMFLKYLFQVCLVYITGLIVWVWCNRNPDEGLNAVQQTDRVALKSGTRSSSMVMAGHSSSHTGHNEAKAVMKSIFWIAFLQSLFWSHFFEVAFWKSLFCSCFFLKGLFWSRFLKSLFESSFFELLCTCDFTRIFLWFFSTYNLWGKTLVRIKHSGVLWFLLKDNAPSF